jgi:hypothetical protein
LRQAIEDLGVSKGEKKRKVKSDETTHIGTFGEWDVYLPHTKESSCQLGAETTWCTSATQSRNYFFDYTADPTLDNAFYYLIKKGAQSRQNPEDKLAIGFRRGFPVFNGEDGGLTIDAANKGLDYDRFEKILGDQAEPALQAMQAHVKSIEDSHPAKQHIEKLRNSKDPSVIDKYLQITDETEKFNFIKMLFRKSPSVEILTKLAGDEDEDVRMMVAGAKNATPEILDKLAEDEEEIVREVVAKNLSTPLETLLKLSRDPSRWVRTFVGRHITYIKHKEEQGMNESLFNQGTNYSKGNIMQLTEEYIKQVIKEEYQAVLDEKKKKSEKDKMKCNSPRRIRKGESGHGKKKFVVKACDGGTEKIIRYGDAGLKIKRKNPGRRSNFRKRHNCKNPGSKLKARYWSCRNW